MKNMIQDIYPLTLKNEYMPDAIPENDDFIIAFSKEKEVLIQKGDVLCFPSLEEYKKIVRDSSVCGSTEKEGQMNNLLYLFRIGEKRFFLQIIFHEEICSVDSSYEWVPLTDIRARRLGPKELRYAYYTAKHLYDWYETTQFCGKCGGRMEHSKTERAMKCTSCGYTAYPRIMPAVIVGVKNKDKLLLTKYRVGFRENALVAGFVEIGETLEETVAREVMEEAGLRVKNITYYKSQPWGMANDILTGFYCEVDGDDTIHMDSVELKYAEWVKREDIVLQSMDDSLTNEMMKVFKEGRE